VIGVVHGDNESLHVVMPGRVAEHAAHCHELTFLSASSG